MLARFECQSEGHLVETKRLSGARAISTLLPTPSIAEVIARSLPKLSKLAESLLLTGPDGPDSTGLRSVGGFWKTRLGDL